MWCRDYSFAALSFGFVLHRACDEGKGEHHTTGDDDRQEVGDTCVEIAKKFRAEAGFSLRGRACRAGIRGMRLLRCARCDVFCTVDQCGGLFDRLCGTDLDHTACCTFCVKPISHFDADSDGEDDDIGSVDFLLGELVVDAHAALRLNLAVDAAFFTFLLKCFLRHIGVRNACGAGRNTDDFH